MEIRYKIVETEEISDENETYTGYGLICTCGGETAIAENISPGREDVERLAAMLEQEGVEPVHLHDVLYDLLADNTVS